MYYSSNNYTVRKCIEELRKVGGTNAIRLRNGTIIVLPEINASVEDQSFSRLKGPKKVMRRILCRIDGNEKTKMIDDLKQRGYCLYSKKEEAECGYSYFGPTEFMLPERVMNEFISANEGIDHYLTVGAYAYMRADMMAMSDY